ncbi:hypothetical protein GDO86_014285 [Hymenochirus boettgeri]|uniref:Uncharacterized protein n=1 Tax=Hymenochirus boettgeri TaxID=247094 RepID=A0A8T2JTM0_9PIPI|nr:hypothetical protein GDO86_014285 [Hymenochirus boettgeri]
MHININCRTFHDLSSEINFKGKGGFSVEKGREWSVRERCDVCACIQNIYIHIPHLISCSVTKTNQEFYTASYYPLCLILFTELQEVQPLQLPVAPQSVSYFRVNWLKKRLFQWLFYKKQSFILLYFILTVMKQWTYKSLCKAWEANLEQSN